MSQTSLFDQDDAPTRRVPMSPAELSRRIGLDFPPTPEQFDAIQAPLRPHLVVAGAGSGKTQTMGLRVVWLVANGLVEPHRVLGLTFTRKAAAELGERVRRMLKRLQQAHEHDPFLTEDVAASLRTGEPVVTTYHSYAAGLVGEHALRIGLEPDTRLVGEAVSWQYAAQVVESYDGAMDSVAYTVGTVVGDVLALAGELSEHLREPGDVVALTAHVRAHLEALPRADGQRTSGHYKSVRDVLGALEARVALLPMVDAYTRLKRSKGAMDYGDQVAVAARIAREHPEVAQIERGRFVAVLLDEYQDTGEAQRVLLTELFGRGHGVTAVGDPRQSIYGWRGASAGNLERFGADFAGDVPAGQSGLTVSFRNGEQILGAANVMAGGIPVVGLADAPLTPGPGRVGAGRVVVALHETVADEAAWVAERVAALGSPDGGSLPWGQIAVLARRRSHFPRLDAELRARGVPCEVVGLGGLLGRPEVVDVVSTLRVLADPAAGAALLRLLTGPRWRLGPRDLDALGRRARRIAVNRGLVPPPGVASSWVTDTTPVPPVDAAEPDFDAVDERSLVDALDDLGGPSSAYSAEGHRRLVLLRDELRRLRRRTSSSLPDLVMAVVRALDLDVELASRPGVRAGDALLDVDRLVEVAEEFAAAGEDPGLTAFLAYLDTATERERGLEVEVAEPDGERVQIMTVHAAKGLEWDAVFVAGLTETVFPVEGRPVADWTKQLATLPFQLRGDRDELPVFDWPGTTDQVAARDALDTFRNACRARGALEERRLAYVAMTRARDVLACSGYWWDTGVTLRGPSELLTEVHQMAAAGHGLVDVWAARPDDGSINPMVTEPPSGMWPFDPLGSRRPAVDAGAFLLRSAAASGIPEHLPGLAAADRRRAEAWDVELELLLAELARQRGRGSGHVVELPARLSVSQLVALREDPLQLARSLRRPLPQRPAPQARRGTRFHLWLEQRWGQQRLLDVDELPGAADQTAEPDADLVSLQQAFQASSWWSRVPVEVEFPFDMVVDGVLLRGRCDAVFADAPDGMVDVVDWKTGRPKSGDAAAAAAVQLAVYRLAWHLLSGTPLSRIRAAFHYVGVNRTVSPADLLDHDGIVALVRSVPTVDGGR
ncbi:MAG: ATP-dependent helicase [Spirochaetaceae bacterium]|nr:ATP-dependent helicase [Spirochaetaceae bacterium]